MRTVLFVLACAWCTGAVAATLTKEVKEGNKKICIYSDGSAITVSSVSLCPLVKP